MLNISTLQIRRTPHKHDTQAIGKASKERTARAHEALRMEIEERDAYEFYKGSQWGGE